VRISVGKGRGIGGRFSQRFAEKPVPRSEAAHLVNTKKPKAIQWALRKNTEKKNPLKGMKVGRSRGWRRTRRLQIPEGGSKNVTPRLFYSRGRLGTELSREQQELDQVYNERWGLQERED